MKQLAKVSPSTQGNRPAAIASMLTSASIASLFLVVAIMGIVVRTNSTKFASSGSFESSLTFILLGALAVSAANAMILSFKAPRSAAWAFGIVAAIFAAYFLRQGHFPLASLLVGLYAWRLWQATPANATVTRLH